jgi:hypothetical protein
MAWGVHFRESVDRWAPPVTQRYGTARVEELLRYPPSRMYGFITWNPPDGSKPMTIELRAPSTHPVAAAACQKIMERILRQVFHRFRITPDASPKLTPDSMERLGVLANKILIEKVDPITALKQVGPFEFLPGRTIPFPRGYTDRIHVYRTGYDVFKTLLYYSMIAYTRKATRFKDWFTRVCWLFYNNGTPAFEYAKIWRCYTDAEFQWDSVPPFPPGGEIPGEE